MRPRHRLLLAIGALAAAVAAVVTVSWLAGRQQLPPLPEVVYGSMPLPPGAPQSLGAILPNPQRKAIRILDVQATVSHNAELIGVVVTVPPASGQYASAVGTGFPPHPAEWELDFREVPAAYDADAFPEREGRQHVEIIVGVRAVSGDFAAVNGISVTYELDGDRRRQYFPVALILCIAPTDCDAAPDSSVLLRRLGVARAE